MVKLVNRAKMKVASGGAGTLTLGTACDGYQTFAAAGVTDQDKLRYTITDGNDWEIGVGTYTASGTTLARAPTESSNSGNAITCGSEAEIFVTMAAEDFSGNAAPVWTTLPPSTLLLKTDGSTAVTLAGVAIDEFPIQYDWDGFSGTTIYSDGNLPPQLASAPTFSGGTASLIGSSTQSNSGNFKFRMKASDGIKTATSTTVVSLIFGAEIDNMTYDSVSFSVSSQTTFPYGLHFSTDGVKMFVIDYTDDRIYQFSLSTTNVISSASYDNVYLDISSQDGSPTGMHFSADGLKLFVCGDSNDSVFSYTLSTAFSLSTASYDNVSFSVASQAQAKGIVVSDDGTKMFVCGDNSYVYQYSMSTAFSLSSASYDSVSYNHGVRYATSFAMNATGTKMFIAAATSDTVKQFDLPSGFNLANASDDNVSFYLGSQDTVPLDFCLSGDQTKAYMAGSSNDTIFQYSL
tara:strand:+ start:71 stop:1453 length:1383 start_codon:yes stop_codon:yes gene_type:complete